MKVRAKPKKKRQGKNKIRKSKQDKGRTQDDLTQIAGIGEATAAKIRSQGIQTLAQLRRADVSALPARARRAVEEWRR